jgi:hypothetical protein
MSTISKTSFGQISFKTIVAGVGFQCLGCGKRASRCNITDGDLQKMIRSTRCVYAQQLKMAWDVKNWDQKSNKASRTKQLMDVLDFHESRMIHGR